MCIKKRDSMGRVIVSAGAGKAKVLTHINASRACPPHFMKRCWHHGGVNDMAKNLSVKTEKKRDVADPAFRPLGLLRDDIDVAFDRMFKSWPFQSRALDVGPFAESFGGDAALQPRVDVSEEDDKFEIVAEVPGVDEKDISLTVKDNLLTLKGEKKSERKEKKKNFYMKERSYGSFVRSFRLPDSVKANKIRAKFANGVVTIEVPKDPKSKAKETRVPIQSK
jgi:HSP20 family protein